MQEAGELRARIRASLEHLEHVLPGQAPIQDFVHHNTLHGFEHLPFPEAVAQVRALTGASGYLPAARYREFYRQGRITRADLVAVLDADDGLGSAEALFETDGGPVQRRELYLAALLHPFSAVTGCQLNWQIEELHALRSFQADVPPEARKRLLTAAGRGESGAIAELWNACLNVLGLNDFLLHPEDLVDLTPERAEAMLVELAAEGERSDSQPPVQQRIAAAAERTLDALLGRVGDDLTLRGLLSALTGRDVLDELRPYLTRGLANFLDQGMAAWHQGNRAEGFYAAWRTNAVDDGPAWMLEELSDWRHRLKELPDDPMEAIVEELTRLELPQERWTGYLERLALELPGWSGMCLWRHLHPGYQGQGQPIRMLDYLAVRLVLERLFARRLCASEWGIPPALELLRGHLRRCPSELLVRYALYNEHLPEYLATRAQRLVQSGKEWRMEDVRPQWQHLAQLIWSWQSSSAADRPGYSVFRSAWPLFRLAQHLGLCGRELSALGRAQLDAVFATLERLDFDTAGFIWLRAYENHYRDEIFNAIVNNQGRGRWVDRSRRPGAQLVFCMDDREEGTRRHLEEIDPGVETLGAAAHFGVPHNWRGLDDREVTGLTPVVFVPCNEIREQARPGNEQLLARHRRRRGWRVRLRDILHQEVRRNLLGSTAAIVVSAPVAAVSLAGKVFAPRWFGALAQRLQRGFDQQVPTDIAFTLERYHGAPSPDNVQLGFTTEEQAQRVGNFLRTIGLDHGFAPLVAIIGHGSDSDNNPHIAAYNCGACSGNHSGPNARMFAAMANRPEVRTLLRENQIDIPDDCWFLGAEHNTCSEAITWYDLDRIPAALRGAFDRLDGNLRQACRNHAQERCRKFFSAPSRPTPEQAIRHVIGRGLDFSQARPELGHATNACAFIGRRSISQGAFFDRRAFLISYDPTRDPDGTVLEPLLLANGPVGAGINLEYYFSTVDNEHHGAGSKVTHNVAGFLGVMEGAGSDLRTGLPKQMIEIHEAMRLLVIVEADIEVLTTLYQRQPPLQGLIGNGWLLLAAKDPESDAIHRFDPARGWIRWQGPVSPLATVERSSDYYPGTMAPLQPVLVEQTVAGG